MWRLLMHPDQLDEVRADTTLSRWAAEEGIRLDPPTAWILRINTMARTWQGIDLPAGSPMLLGAGCLAEGVGFEPTEACTSHAFEACPFGRSGILPPGRISPQVSDGHGRSR